MLVVGTVAFDSIETPKGSVERVLGGSGTFSSYAASFFTKPRLIGVVGEDFPDEYRRLLADRGIDTSGLVTQPGGKTFFWKGKYHQNMNDRDTMEVQLNVIEHFDPVVPGHFKDSRYVFLGNFAPGAQSKVLDQVADAEMVIADTMDFWIQSAHQDLLKMIRRVNGLCLNDSEAKLLTGQDNLIKAAAEVRKMGPEFVIVKKGEHGAMLCTDDGVFVMPAYPLEEVVDPTGAGDSFAGAIVGHLVSEPGHAQGRLRRSMAYGTVVASLTCEGFGLERLKQADNRQVEERLGRYRGMLAF